MLWKRVAAVLLLAIGRESFAQRTGNESICDYYATQRYGANNVTTQLLLIQSIVTLAYAGSSGLPNPIDDNTGIFNNGNFEGIHVYLRPWFDGSKATTNLNNQPVGIDWLDGGATGPLMSFLNGSSNSVNIDTSTNQYRLFTHWFTAFGFVYGCSLAPKFPRTADSGGPLSMAYVHKFMDLNQTHIGYFIEQLTLSSKYFGFSDEDAQTLDTFMNARYNVRCAPAINGQLYSICFADECPLAQPKPDCDAYKDIGPSGASNVSVVTTTVNPASPTTSATTTSAPPSSTTTAAPAGDSSPNPDSKSSSTALSGGAIAGIAIGGAAVLLLAVGLLLYYRRHSSKPQIVPVPVPSDGYGSPAHPPHAYYAHASMASSSNPHETYVGGHEAHMGGHANMSGFWAPPKPHEMGQTGHDEPVVPRPATMSPQLAEMESP
ncbi:uncharacterized protein TRIVIDRAFT_34285 [Trichoderma virens Gv29-8]|uniref:Uncharacterized protein n=1 Tax=Hypocrea virens (strain Gv29-8 / FGSC 10586) TaxID=413071 RepID=G9MEG0_HYPVG|nr:uncharacterized protein TRIVIDRAFT_34285 [Trichoderma virens Gv29-8]EHK27441.1 hypothetical protein TRIVIDRAFT_34285 [Trichoderma virens Gv29-8]